MDVPTLCSSARSASPDASTQYAPHMRPCRTCTLTRLRLTGSYGASICANVTGQAPASPRFLGRSETLARLRLRDSDARDSDASRLFTLASSLPDDYASPRASNVSAGNHPFLRAIESTIARFRPRARLPFHTAHAR
jgi:hypothetical protein